AAQKEIVLHAPASRWGGSGAATVLARVAAGRTLAWARNVSSNDDSLRWYQIMPSIAVDRSGAVAVIVNEERETGRATIVSKLDRRGDQLWSHCFSTESGTVSNTAIAFADDGAVWAAGNFQNGDSHADCSGPFFLVHYGSSGEVIASSVHQRGSKLV